MEIERPSASVMQIPPVVKAARVLFVLNALIWLAIGIASLLRMGTAQQPAPPVVLLVVALLMFANAAAMLLVAAGLTRRRQLFFWLGIAVLLVNVLLTFTDQFGILDLVTLLIDLALFGLLVASRSFYLQSQVSIQS